MEPVRLARAGSISWCCIIGVAGCGPNALDDGDGDGTGSATGGATTTSTGDSSASSTAAPATTETGTSDDATTLADSTGMLDGTETGDAACEPAMDVTATFTVSPDEPLSETCTVTAVRGDPTESVITLDCSGAVVTLTIATTPSSVMPSVAVDQLVHLEHAVDLIFWTNRWFALHTAGGESDSLLAGGVEGSALDPPGTTLDAFFGSGSFAAPTVTPVEGLCMPVDDSCGPLERIALDFTLADSGTTRVFDHTSAFIDVLAFGWSYTVEQATQYPRQQTCDDAPPAWFDFVMVWFPSD